MSEVCPECGMDHYRDILRKDRTQERIRLLRKAISLLCENNPALINQAMCNAEKDLYGEEVKLRI